MATYMNNISRGFILSLAFSSFHSFAKPENSHSAKGKPEKISTVEDAPRSDLGPKIALPSSCLSTEGKSIYSGVSITILKAEKVNSIMSFAQGGLTAQLSGDKKQGDVSVNLEHALANAGQRSPVLSSDAKPNPEILEHAITKRLPALTDTFTKGDYSQNIMENCQESFGEGYKSSIEAAGLAIAKNILSESDHTEFLDGYEALRKANEGRDGAVGTEALDRYNELKREPHHLAKVRKVCGALMNAPACFRDMMSAVYNRHMALTKK
jgi:hypothetical protein